MEKITTLFLDIGGVLMTNGWDHPLREKAAKTFDIDFEEFEKLHKKYYDIYESGFETLDAYLDQVIFWKPRNFTLEDFKAFMFDASTVWPEMLDLIKEVKKKYQLKIAFVSNEGRELTLYRFKQAQLTELSDHFFISCFVHLQKPSPLIYQLALDVMQLQAAEVLYIEDRPKMIEAAQKLGIQGIEQKSFEETKQKLMEIL